MKKYIQYTDEYGDIVITEFTDFNSRKSQLHITTKVTVEKQIELIQKFLMNKNQTLLIIP